MTKFYFLILCLFSFGFLSAQEELSKEEKERKRLRREQRAKMQTNE